jgi:2,3-bisphosphoglycerate-dependent phosphoglycerate mutase
MAVKRVMVIRPGETYWNREGRWQGHVAVPLTPHGIAQAQRLAQFIVPIGLDALYSSDLYRARQTAAILAEHADLSPVYDQRLRERAMGEWQGLTIHNVIEWYPAAYERLQDNPHTFQLPAGESRQQVAKRVMACFRDIVARGGETVALISHSTALGILLDELVPETDPFEIEFRNMSVTTLVADEQDRWHVSQFDDVSHLEGMDSQPFPKTKGAQKI